MWRGLVVGLLLLMPGVGGAQSLRPSAHITTQTTTVLVAPVAGQQVQVYSGSLCVDANGTATGIALQSTAGTNILGTNLVYVIPAGACLWFPTKPNNQFYGIPTAAGTGLQVVTTVGNGPVNVYLEVSQR